MSKDVEPVSSSEIQLFNPEAVGQELVELHSRLLQMRPVRDELVQAISQIVETYPDDHSVDRREDYWGFHRDNSLLAQDEQVSLDPRATGKIQDALGRRDGVVIDPLQYLVIKAEQLARATGAAAILQEAVRSDEDREHEIIEAFRMEAIERVQSIRESAIVNAKKLGGQKLADKFVVWFRQLDGEIMHSRTNALRKEKRAHRFSASYGYTHQNAEDALLQHYGGQEPARLYLPGETVEGAIGKAHEMLDFFGEMITADHSMQPEEIAHQTIIELVGDQKKRQANLPTTVWASKLATKFQQIVAAVDTMRLEQATSQEK